MVGTDLAVKNVQIIGNCKLESVLDYKQLLLCNSLFTAKLSRLDCCENGLAVEIDKREGGTEEGKMLDNK